MSYFFVGCDHRSKSIEYTDYIDEKLKTEKELETLNKIKDRCENTLSQNVKGNRILINIKG